MNIETKEGWEKETALWGFKTEQYETIQYTKRKLINQKDLKIIKSDKEVTNGWKQKTNFWAYSTNNIQNKQLQTLVKVNIYLSKTEPKRYMIIPQIKNTTYQIGKLLKVFICLLVIM